MHLNDLNLEEQRLENISKK